jgi:hypothetical protein
VEVRIRLICQKFHIRKWIKNYDSHWFSVSLRKCWNGKSTIYFCLSRINYIYRTISYLRTTVSTAENVVILIYQSDKIFPNNLRVIYLGINYISVKNIPLWRRDDLNFHIMNFPLIYSNIPAELVYRTYISHLIRYS